MKQANWVITFLFGDREHLRTLIISTITATAVPDPKAKILTVGLAVIGSLAVDMYDKYCECQMHLANASYHFEMVNFYRFFSLKLSNLSNDEGTKAFLRAIDCLILCDMLAYLIKDSREEYNDVRDGVTEGIREYENYLMKEFKEAKGKLTKKLSLDGWTLYENLDEMLCICDGRELSDKIEYNIREMVINLEAAERFWKIY